MIMTFLFIRDENTTENEGAFEKFLFFLNTTYSRGNTTENEGLKLKACSVGGIGVLFFNC